MLKFGILLILLIVGILAITIGIIIYKRRNQKTNNTKSEDNGIKIPQNEGTPILSKPKPEPGTKLNEDPVIPSPKYKKYPKTPAPKYKKYSETPETVVHTPKPENGKAQEPEVGPHKPENGKAPETVVHTPKPENGKAQVDTPKPENGKAPESVDDPSKPENGKAPETVVEPPKPEDGKAPETVVEPPKPEDGKAPDLNENFDRYENPNAPTVNEIKKKSHVVIRREYENILKTISKGTTMTARMSPTKGNNMTYVSVDATRVQLKVPSNQTNFFDANFVDGSKKKKEYIATQTPLHETLADFWQMIHEQEVDILILLTREVKGPLYWPQKTGEIMIFGDYSIENIGASKDELFETTQMQLKYEKKDEDKRVIHHFLYDEWTKNDEPPDQRHFLKFIKTINKFQMSINSESPKVVHCCNGYSRSGVYIAVDILTKLLERNNKVSIVRVVNELRQQRMHVISESQYIFLYEFVKILDYSK